MSITNATFAKLEKDLGGRLPEGYRPWCIGRDADDAFVTVWLRNTERTHTRMGRGQTIYDAAVAACRAVPVKEDQPCN